VTSTSGGQGKFQYGEENPVIREIRLEGTVIRGGKMNVPLPKDGWLHIGLTGMPEDVKRLRNLSGTATPLNQEFTRGKAVEGEIVARQAEDHRQSKPLVIDVIHAEGNLRETPSFWTGYEQLSKEALRERATRLLEASPGLKVVFRADRTMKHEHVAELLELLKAAGAKNVSLAVFPLGSVFAIDPGPGRDGTIRGKVIAPNHRGRPVSYVVTLNHEAWANQLGENPSLQVAVGETFEFRNVPAGKCEVRARPVTAPGQNAALAANTVEVEVIVKNKQAVEVEISFDPTDDSSPDERRGTTAKWADRLTSSIAGSAP
jgi:biopolymer transport protein ExbD